MGAGGGLKIDLIGAGEIPRGFLRREATQLDIRMFSRSATSKLGLKVQSIKDFRPSDRVVILCASANEEHILRTSRTGSRVDVARANLRIVRKLLQMGIFDRQTVFVLSNPSEIIAEYIFRHTNNRQIYALGLQTDQKRYLEILEERNIGDRTKNFSVSGNHYDFPYPIFQDSNQLSPISISVLSLKSALQDKVKGEFRGFRPPVESGINTLRDLILAMQSCGKLSLSGFSSELDCFIGGVFNFASRQFSPSVGNTFQTKDNIEEIARRHRITYQIAISEASIGENI